MHVFRSWPARWIQHKSMRHGKRPEPLRKVMVLAELRLFPWLVTKTNAFAGTWSVENESFNVPLFHQSTWHLGWDHRQCQACHDLAEWRRRPCLQGYDWLWCEGDQIRPCLSNQWANDLNQVNLQTLLKAVEQVPVAPAKQEGQGKVEVAEAQVHPNPPSPVRQTNASLQQ